VVLSLQLPFAVIPLIQFTSDRKRMGEFANKLWVKVLAWIAAIVIVALNAQLVIAVMGNWIAAAAELHWYHYLSLLVAVGLALLLLYLFVTPYLRARQRIDRGPTYSLADLSASSHARIAVALEATNRDRAVLAQVIQLAKQQNAELLLIHVAEGMGPRFWKRESEDKEVRSDSAYLERLQLELAEQGIESTIELGFGEPSKEIIRIIEASDATLLVMGTHGHRFPHDLIYGATATRVRHALRIPIFMIPTREHG
jgi:manganese transport protein